MTALLVLAPVFVVVGVVVAVLGARREKRKRGL